MSHGLIQLFYASFTSGSSLSSDVAFGRGFKRVFIDIAGATNSIHFQVAHKSGNVAGTYSTLKYNVASGMSAPQTVTVGTAASGSYVEVPLGAFPFAKVVNVGGAADGASLKIVACDE